MKDLRNSNYFVLLYGVVLFLFCVSTSAYAELQSRREGVFIFEDEGLKQFISPTPVSL